MSDNISRQEAMAYPLSWEHYDKEHGDMKFICGVESYREYIEHLPSAQQWISCSEKLPDDLEEVNVTWINTDPEPYYDFLKGKPFTGSAVYYKGRWFWYSAVCTDYLGEYGFSLNDFMDASIKVVAWMPLPEPYKGGAE